MQVEGHKNGPLPGERWASFLQKTALVLACLLLASALICWVAANWEHASAFQKLAGAQALLISVVLVTWRLVYAPAAHGNPNFAATAAMSGLAAVGTGALLALVGQIYQTGADSWELFLWWAVLLVPWLVALPSVFLGMLCAVLLNTSAALYLGIYGGGFVPGHSQWLVAGLLLAAMNGLLLALWEAGSRWLGDHWRIGGRGLALFVLGWLLVSALAAANSDGSALVAWAGAAPGLLAAALMARVYALRRVDMAIVSAAAFASLCLVSIPLFAWMDLEPALLITIVIWVATVSVVVRRLRAPQGHTNAKPATMDGPGAEPWFISLFRLAAMGLTAILTLAFLFAVVDIPVDFLWLVGFAACAGGVLVLRMNRGAILHEVGLTLTAAGLFMACAGLYVIDGPEPGVRAAALLALGLVLYKYGGAGHPDAGYPGAGHLDPGYAHSSPLRFLSAFLVLGVASALTWPSHSHYDLTAVSGAGRVWVYFPAYLRLWWLAVAAIIALAVGHKRRDPEFWSPLAWALVCLTQLVAWVAPAPSTSGLSAVWLQTPGLLVLWLAFALLAPVVLGALLWRARGLSLRLGAAAPLALAVASLGWTGAPGIGLALVWLILGHVQRRRALMVFGVLALLAYLARFYYQLDSTLLQKSLMLSLTGAWLLLCWIGLLRLRRPAITASSLSASEAATGSASASPLPSAYAGPGDRVQMTPTVLPAGASRSDLDRRRRAIGLVGGLMLILLVVNLGIAHRERILASGARVVLALAPVDPRSLMQGDYMALRFEVAEQLLPMVDRAPAEVANRIEGRQGGYLTLGKDAQGVHRLQAVAGRLSASPAISGLNATAEANATSEVNASAASTDQALLEFRLRDGQVRIVTDAWFFPEGSVSQYEGARYGELRVDGQGRGLLTGLLDSQLKPLN
jgi:uncharacterized membrane protein/uncharacterized membrane-anchored protein